jgi:hypothetical protein
MTEFHTYSQLFENILSCPIKYVTCNTISLIHMFIEGYKHATLPDYLIEGEIYMQFDSFVAKKFNIRTSHNWESIITFMGGSELSAYELTKELWEEHKLNQPEIKPNVKNIVEISKTRSMKSSELLEKILERPPLFLGHESVPRMKAFIDGYIFAHSISSIEINDSLYKGFQKYVSSRFGFEDSKSWASVISFMGSSETGSFKLAKELWEEYKIKMKT